MKNITLLIAAMLFMFLSGFAEEVTITDSDLAAGNTYNWTNDNVYVLDGFVYLEDGGVLNIEPGTVIKGKETPTSGDNASALIICQGAKIFANGSPEQPVIFTAYDDDVADPTDLDETDRGLWGGLIILGYGEIGFSSETSYVEGIPEGEERAKFGGTDNTDNSGELRYVSIRHGGAELSPGDEINGLTLGAVGNGTVVEHIEVFANSDDGIEWFGGAVNCKWLVVSYCKDDAFDYDFGWRGKGQFWFAKMARDESENGGEHDGAKPDDATPFSKPTIYNATYIGSGTDVENIQALNSTGILFRDATGGIYANSIFTEFAHEAVEVEDLAAGEGVDSRQRMEDGDLKLLNNLWYNFAAGDEWVAGELIRATDNAEDPTCQFLIDHLTNNNNTHEDPMLRGISHTADGQLDPRPKAGSPAFNNAADIPANDDFFTEADYRGAFGYSNWALTWTAIGAHGFFGDLPYGGSGETIVVTDNDLNGDAHWTADKTYLLDGFVYLESGQLTIDAGTVIKGKEVPTSGDNASALIICQGAKIKALGTNDLPIVFTAESDDLSDATDLDETDRGLWGGLIVLGYGELGFSTETAYVEGIPEGEERAKFGGTDNTDNSGILRYISIRHGGAELSPGDEINGLTLAGIGSGTVIEHIEVFANDDDGFEWFGGAANCKWLVSAFNKDDAFDYDFGWQGKGQFWFVIQGTDEAENGGEHDGAKPDDATPFSKPTIYNATYIGSGSDASSIQALNSTGILFRDATGGIYANSIITEYAHEAIEIEDLAAGEGVDSYQRLKDGDLQLLNNLWYDFGAGDEWVAGELIRITDGAEDATGDFLISHVTNNNNTHEDPMLRGISRTADAQLDPRPKAGSPALSGATNTPANDDFFTPVAYRGAFSDVNWAKTWTCLGQNGYFGDLSGGFAETTVVVSDADLTGDAHWTANNQYILDGFVYLESGTLTIDPGTIIKGREVPTSGDNASALIICQGAKIDAQGTSETPIVFTAEDDDIEDNADLDHTDRGLWGGLILLGYGELGFSTETAYVEGIPEGEERAKFGGTNNEDDSGILRYISIRHGGAELSPGDEINGLTLGGVGSGTVIEHVEVFANDDDGIEWFGGAAQCKWLISAFCKDDAFDYDFGWRGKGQFWFTIQATDESENGGEHDGAKPDDATPFSKPTIYNATYIGSGTDAGSVQSLNSTGILFRDAAGGTYANSIFTSYLHEAIEVEDLAAGEGVDSRQRMEDGDLNLLNNIWFDFGAGDEWVAGELIRATENAEDPTAQFLIDHVTDNDNTIEDPLLWGIGRTAAGGLDPRPKDNSPAVSGTLAELPGDDFFTQVGYKGAFENSEDGNWASVWTALAEYGYFEDLYVGVEKVNGFGGYELSQNYPNPFNSFTTINYTVPQRSNVNITVFDLSGKMVRSLVNDTKAAGTYKVEVSNLESGMYFYRMTANGVSITKKMIVTK